MSDVEALKKEIVSEAAAFLAAFEAVFHHDWDHTAAQLNPANRNIYIASGHTFADPAVTDEAEDWGNRAALLSSYRALTALFSRLDTIEPPAHMDDQSP